MKPTEKECPWCKKTFVTTHASRKYCCDSHRISAYNKRKGITVTKVTPDNIEHQNGMAGLPETKQAREEETKQWVREVIQEEMKTSFSKVLQEFGIGTAASATGIGLYQKINSKDHKLVTNIDLDMAFRKIQKDLIAIDHRLARIENPGDSGKKAIDLSMLP